MVAKKASSPKLQVQNTALMSAITREHFADIRQQPEIWGRHVESVVGMHLINAARTIKATVYYWREGSQEVDFVWVDGQKILAIEVKSGLKKQAGGLKAFKTKYPTAKTMLVGGSGIPLDEFLKNPITLWLAL